MGSELPVRTKNLLLEAAVAVSVPVTDSGMALSPLLRKDVRLVTIELSQTHESDLDIELDLIKKGTPYVDFAVLAGEHALCRKRFSDFCLRSTFHLPRATPDQKTVDLCVSTYWIGATLTRLDLRHASRKQPDMGAQDLSAPTDVRAAFRQLSEGFDCTQLDLIELDEIADRAEDLKGAGLDHEAIEALFCRSLTHGTKNDWAAGSPVVDLSYKRRFLETEYGRIRSPRTGGDDIHALSSLPLPERMVTSVAYEYHDGFPFVLFSDVSFSGSVALVFFPTLNLLFFDRNYWSLSWRRAEDVLNQYLALLAQRGADLEDYRGQMVKPLLITKTCRNMGHFFYNELCGALSLVPVAKQLGRLDIAELHDNWVDCANYLPQDSFNVIRTHADALLDRVLAERAFLIRPTASRVDPANAESIRRSGLAVFECNIPDRYGEFRRICRDYDVLFVNLRAHNKSWDRQVEGLARFIDCYATRVDRPVAVVFDGFRDCTDVMEEIRAKIDPDILAVNGLDVTMEETLAWSYHCDFFIAVIGSGLVPLTWLGDRTGICFAERQHMKQLEFWSLVRDAEGTLYHPRVTKITQNTNVMYSNFDFPDDELDRLLDEHFADHSDKVLQGTAPLAT